MLRYLVIFKRSMIENMLRREKNALAHEQAAAQRADRERPRSRSWSWHIAETGNQPCARENVPRHLFKRSLLGTDLHYCTFRKLAGISSGFIAPSHQTAAINSKSSAFPGTYSIAALYPAHSLQR